MFEIQINLKSRNSFEDKKQTSMPHFANAACVMATGYEEDIIFPSGTKFFVSSIFKYDQSSDQPEHNVGLIDSY